MTNVLEYRRLRPHPPQPPPLTPNVTVAISGVGAASALGVLAIGVLLSGVSATGQAGQLQTLITTSTPLTLSISGLGTSATGLVGTLRFSGAMLAGNAGTTSVNFLQPKTATGSNLSIGLLASGSAGSVGNLFVSGGPITGVAATTSLGLFGVMSTPGGPVTRSVSGVVGTTALQALPHTTAPPLTTVLATTGVGTLSLPSGLTRPLTSVTGTTSLTALAGTGRTITPTGLSASGVVNNIGGVSGTLTGVSATGTVGTLGRTRTLPITGVGTGATTSVGSLVPVPTRALTGLPATTAVGLLTQSRTLPLTGLSATGSVGFVIYSASTNPSAGATTVTGTTSLGPLIVTRSKTLTTNLLTATVGGLGQIRLRGLTGVLATGVPGALGSGAPVLDSPAVFVSTSGNDSFVGDIGHPFRTLTKGLSVIGAGVTVYLRGLPSAAGVYDEGIFSCPSGSSWSSKVRIAAYPGETVWMTPTVPFVNNNGNVVRFYSGEHYIEFDGINMDGQLMTYGTFASFFYDAPSETHHIRLKNCEIIARTGSRLSEWAGLCVDLGAHMVIGAQGGFEIQQCVLHGGGASDCGGPDNRCSAYGIYLATPNSLVEHCDIYDTSSAGIHIYNGGGDDANNNIIRNNRIHDIVRTGNVGQVWGILVVGDHNQVYNNLIYGLNVGLVAHGNGAIVVQHLGNQIINNTIYHNISDAINIDTNATGTIVQNNICYNNGYNPVWDDGTGTIAENNLIGVNPLFVNAGAANFHLQPGSPAINTGLNVTMPTTDFDGVSRPQGPAYDIGAYEFPEGIPGDRAVPITGVGVTGTVGAVGAPVVGFLLTAHASAGSTDSTNVTTPAINTTGANLLILSLVSASTGTGVTDSQGNTWHPLTAQGASNGIAVRLFYAFAPTVGAGHTFSYSESGTDPALTVAAFSGARVTDPFDVQNGAATTGEVASLQTGSITPSLPNAVVVTAACFANPGASPFTINAGFTLLDTVTMVAANWGLAFAYKIQSVATAENPTWTYTCCYDNVAASIATFRAGP